MPSYAIPCNRYWHQRGIYIHRLEIILSKLRKTKEIHICMHTLCTKFLIEGNLYRVSVKRWLTTCDTAYLLIFILFYLRCYFDFFYYLIYSIVSFHDLLRTTGSMLILKGTMEEQNRYEKLWLLHVILYNYCIPVKYKTEGLYRSGI